MGRFFRRLRYLLNRRRLDQELQNDLEFHSEMAAGGDRRLGNTLRLRQDAREAWGWMWIDRLAQDLRYSGRTLRRSPGFTLAAVLVLATGIGINITAFGLFDMSVLKSLPVREPDTILQFHRTSSLGSATLVTYPAVDFYTAHSTKLSAVMAMSAAALTLGNDTNPVSARFVTPNFFGELGAQPALGRVLNPAWDAGRDSDPVVVLDYRFWQRRFASSPSVVGSTIRLNRRSVVVIGVASPKFTGLESGRSDVWLPIARLPYFVPGSPLLTSVNFGEGVIMWGRLKQDVPAKVAEQELSALTAALRTEHPENFWPDERLAGEPGAYASERGPDSYAAFGLVAALMLLILVVACANLGGLLLARGVAREREIAIRVALGAGRKRIVGQLFTETLLLAFVGSGVAVALSYVLFRTWMALTETPAWVNPVPDWRVSLFAVSMGLLAALWFGAAPALQAARRPYGTPTSVGRRSESRAGKVLVGAQVAASAMLLIVAGLLVHALQHALYTPPGFEVEHVVAIDPGLAAHGFKPAEAENYLDDMTTRLRQVPGVESVSLSSVPPLGNYNLSIIRMTVAGRRVDAYVNHVDPEFFHTMDIPLLQGGNFTPGDTDGVILSESLARREWPGGDALGKRLSTGPDETGEDQKYTVVGVAGNARIAALHDSEAVEIYHLAQDRDMPSMSVLVRLRGNSEGPVANFRSVAGEINPQVLPAIRLLKSSFREQLQPLQRGALLAGAMGTIALLLAVVGILGLVAYAVSQRTQEIGIRIVLGAGPMDVLRTILGQFLRPIVLGVLLGAIGAAALSQLLRHALFGISSLDVVSFSAAIGLVVAISALAALVPARRALRIDPMRALRHE